MAAALESEAVGPVDPRSIALFALRSASMMAHAPVDPDWRAKVRCETAMTPEAALVIGNARLSCHAPMQQYEARPSGGSGETASSGLAKQEPS